MNANNNQFLSRCAPGIISVILLAFILSYTGYSQSSFFQMLDPSKQENFYDIQKKFNEYWKGNIPKKGYGWKQYKRWEWFWEPRLYPTGNPPDVIKIRKEWKNYVEKNQKNNDRTLNISNWTFLGPSDMPAALPDVGSSGLGRINCIAFDKNNPLILWVGAAYGGIWKSTDGGYSWHTFPFTNFLSIGISDIKVAESNSNIVYAATGDADGSLSGSACYSIGIIKTTDGGNTWEQTAFQDSVSQGVIINKILINPTNPDIVLAAASNGMFKTTDGGATWNSFLGFYCRDMIFKPSSSDTIFGAVIGPGAGGGFVNALIKCSLSSSSWTPIQYGFKTTDVIRMALCVTPANPEYIYVLSVKTDLGLNAVGRSTDGGYTWKNMIGGSPTTNLLGANHDASDSDSHSQGQYDLCIAASPLHADTVYLGGVNIWRSTDGGNGWRLAGEWTGQYTTPYVHADQHSLAFSPNTDVLYSTNDGGVKRTSNGGVTWDDISAGLGVTQFYRISSSRTLPGLLFGGAQDNGTFKLLNGNWQEVLGGDGMETVVDPLSNSIVYGSLYYGDFYKSADGGVSWGSMLNPALTGEKGGWVTPLIIDPTNSLNLYAGYINVFKSTNRGAAWKKITNFDTLLTPLTCLAIAPSDPNTVYVAKTGGMWKSTNGGQTWIQLLIGNAITGLEIDPKNPKRIWCTVSGYNDSAKVYYFDGTTLTSIHGSLPNVPVNCIKYQKNNPAGIDGLYIGTDVGVFYRDSRMDDWQLYGNGLPNVVVNDLDINYTNLKLYAGTYGRGLWQTDLVSCLGALPVVQVDGSKDICDGDSVKLEVTTNYQSIKWSTGETGNSIWVKIEGKYMVTVTDASNCTYTSNPININVHIPPDVSIKATGDTTICKGDSLVLTANPRFGFSSFSWSNGATGRVITVTDAGQYTVTGTTSDGCKKTSQPITVTVKDAPPKPTITKQGNLLIASDGVTYQWYLNGVAIKNSTSKTIVIVNQGKYTVKITDSKGCWSLSDPFDTISAVEDNETPGFNVSIHPNPTPGIFNIEINSAGSENINIEISDMNGKTFFEKRNIIVNNNYKLQVDLQGQASGIYFVKIVYRNNQILKKLIKE